MSMPSDTDLGSIDPFDPQHWDDPHPIYHRLRAAAPIWRNERFGEWVLTRHRECEAVLRDPRFSSNPRHLRHAPERNLDAQDLRTDLAGLDANILLFMDPPDHTRLRRLVSKAFSPSVVERLRPRICELVDDMLSEAGTREGGTFDVIEEVAYPLPVIVICEMLGVPVEDRHLFGQWSSDATRMLDGDLDMETANRGTIAALSLLNYLNGLIVDRRQHPGDDLLSALIHAEDDGQVLTEEELRLMTLLLFLAGHETTMNLIGNGTYALLRHRDQWDRLRADPGLATPAVEELLRYDGPVHVTARIPVEDVEVGDHRFAAGEQLLVLLAAANRDPERFADPDALDLTRPDNRHLTFSGGIHFCLGAALARVEGQEALRALTRRFPTLELVDELPPYRDHRVLRGLRRLEVAVG